LLKACQHILEVGYKYEIYEWNNRLTMDNTRNKNNFRKCAWFCTGDDFNVYHYNISWSCFVEKVGVHKFDSGWSLEK
jgi:hypothetical protein